MAGHGEEPPRGILQPRRARRPSACRRDREMTLLWLLLLSSLNPRPRLGKRERLGRVPPPLLGRLQAFLEGNDYLRSIGWLQSRLDLLGFQISGHDFCATPTT